MKRVWGHVLAAATLLGGGVSGVSACTHDNSTLFIRNVLAQQLVTNGQQCLFTSDPTQPYISSGALDLAFRTTYDAEYLVGNQTVPVGNPSTPNTETSRITIQGGIVRITDSAGMTVKSFTRYTSGTVDPLTGTSPSFIPIGLTILDQDTVLSYVGALSQPGRPSVRLVTYVRFYGNTLGGDYVESNEFEFPIDVCIGCLISFAPQDIDPNFSAPNCLGAKTGSATTLPVPCNRGEDFDIDCSQCQDIPECNPAATGGVIDAGSGG